MLKSFSQWGFGFINFEDTSNLYRIEIDTSIPGNIWQIGAPYKSMFVSAHSIPNAIVTDTLTPYPVNNTSIFYYRTSGDHNTDAHAAGLGFWYKMDSDTLNDFGKVEISIDTGSTWYNLATFGSWVIYDSIFNVVSASWSSNDSIVFTGRTNGWYMFSCNAILPEMIIDSIIYRFTFHSSGVSTFRDGWMIDDIQFNTWWESVANPDKSCLVYPDPVKDEFSINSAKHVVYCEISDISGQIVKRINDCKFLRNINVSDLQTGLYFYKIKFEDDQVGLGKFVKI